MHVEMLHRLVSIRSAVNDAAETRFRYVFLTRDVSCRARQLTQQFGIFITRFGEAGDVLARDYQIVNRRLRRCVAKCNSIGVLVDNVRWDLAKYYAAKYAISHASVYGGLSSKQSGTQVRAQFLAQNSGIIHRARHRIAVKAIAALGGRHRPQQYPPVIKFGKGADRAVTIGFETTHNCAFRQRRPANIRHINCVD